MSYCYIKQNNITIFIVLGFILLTVLTGCNYKEKNDSEQINDVKVDESSLTKKYVNSKYGYSFEYPAEFTIEKDNEDKTPFQPEGYWKTQIISPGFEIQDEEESTPKKIISGFSILVNSNPQTSAADFEKLKEIKRLGFGGRPIVINEEIKEIGPNKFFIQTFQKQGDIIGREASLIYEAGLVVDISITGTEEHEEEMNTVLNHLLESFL